MAEERQTIDMRDLGQTGLKRFSGFIFEEFLHELVGWKGIKIYQEMGDNDATVGAVLFAIDKIIRGVQWRTKPASQEPFDLEASEFLESCMSDMSHTWSDTIAEVLTMLRYGYSFHEIVYKRRCGDSTDPSMRSKHSDGRIGWRKIPIRSQDTIYRWIFDDNGGIQGAEQLAPPFYRYTQIPIQKALLFRTTTEKNNPEGKSILRTAYRAWYIKKNLENIEGIGMERDLAGLPVIGVPPDILSSNASAQQKAILAHCKEIVTNIRRDEQEGVVFPLAYDANGKPLYELKLLSTGGQRQFDTDKIITRYDQRIAMACLADFILLGQNAVGSFALSTTKINLFTTSLKAFLNIIADTFNRYAIPRLFELNPDMQISDYPQICPGDVDNVNLEELGNYIQKLAGAGAPLFPNMDLEKYLMKVAKLPEPVDPLSQPLSMQINPKVRQQPTQTEIPAPPENKPNLTPDTSPINGAPKAPLVTNEIGNTGVDHIQAMSNANRIQRDHGF